MAPKCPICLLNRAYMECKMVTDDYNIIRKAIGEALKILMDGYLKNDINSHVATRMHRKVYEVLGVEDPYKKLKEKAKAIVTINADQKGRAIGKVGLNIRLASMLTKHEIELNIIEGASTQEDAKSNEDIAPKKDASELEALFK